MSEHSEQNQSNQTSTIHITAHGDLRIEGYDGSTVRMRYDEVNQESSLDQDIHIEAHDDAYLQVPAGVTIEISRLGGDASISNVGEVTAGSIAGDLRLSDISLGFHGDSIGGDLKAHNVINLELDTIGGDFRGEGLRGEFAVEMIGGDAYIRGELDSLPPMNVGGDLRLITNWLPDRDYRVTVGGDASIAIDEGASVILSATVGGDVRGVRGSRGPGTFSASWGEGDARVELTVGGDLHISGAGAQAAQADSDHERRGHHEDWSGVFQDFAEEMTAMGREIAAQFRSFGKEWGLNNSEQAAERARQAAERATERAAAAAERMKVRINDREIRFDPERLERIKEQAQRAAEEGIARAQEAIERALSGMDFGSGPRPPRAPRAPRPPRAPNAPFPPRAPHAPHAPQRINIDLEPDDESDTPGPRETAPPLPATGQTIPFNKVESAAAAEKTSADLTQERMAILRMVESGKISAEEAALLLEALG